jgi:replicative DNA helicase
MAQLNRDVENRSDPTPRLSDLRDSGSIEQDADTVLLLHQDGEENKETGVATVVVNIAKHRNGPTGQVRLSFLKRFMRFENSAAESPFATCFTDSRGQAFR